MSWDKLENSLSYFNLFEISWRNSDVNSLGNVDHTNTSHGDVYQICPPNTDFM